MGCFSRKSVADLNLFSGTWSFKCKRETDWIIIKFKANYYVRGGVQKRPYSEPLNSYYPVIHWNTVRLVLTLKCIIGLQSQIIDFTNSFSRAYISSGEPVFIELPRYFKSDGGKCDVVFRSKKIIYGQAEAAHLWYENLQNGLLDSGFVVSKVDPFLFMYKTVIFVVYVDNFLIWARSQSNIDNVL